MCDFQSTGYKPTKRNINKWKIKLSKTCPQKSIFRAKFIFALLKPFLHESLYFQGIKRTIKSNNLPPIANVVKT